MLSLIACGHFQQTINTELSSLKPLLFETTGRNFRRIDRFIQLALIGSSRCLEKVSINPETSVIIGSTSGDISTTVKVLQGIYIDQLPPKPLQFINTVSNTACFYLAQHFNLNSSSNFVSHHSHAFLSALKLAWIDIQQLKKPQVIVGLVEACIEPLNTQRERLQLPSDAPLFEVSHWFLFQAVSDTENRNDESQATIHSIKHFENSETAAKWVQKTLDELPATPWLIDAHQLSSETRDAFAFIGKANETIHWLDELATEADPDSSHKEANFIKAQVGLSASLLHYLNSKTPASLLHITENDDGSVTLIVAENCAVRD